MSEPVPIHRQDFNAAHPDRPGVTVGEDLADQNMTLAFKLVAAESSLEAERARTRALEDALRATDDLLRHLSGWDMLYVSPEGKPVTADAPHWQRRIREVRESVAALCGGDSE